MARPAIIKASDPVLSALLRFVRPGSEAVYSARRFSSTGHPSTAPVSLTALGEMSENTLARIAAGYDAKFETHPKGLRLDLSTPQVMRVRAEDIEINATDRFGGIVVGAGSDMLVHYGKKGIAPSSLKLPRDLLVHSLAIPKGTYGVLDVLKHVPFSIFALDPTKSFAVAGCPLEEVLTHEENIKRYSLNTSCSLSPDDAKRLSIEIQRRIFNDYTKQKFYEEVTSIVYKPNPENRSSGTLMNFESEDHSHDRTTAMHYHPGERSLHIITTKKPAAVTLNFCGIAENPDERKDCEVHLKFPENSMLVLNFPPCTHHKFHGDFVCMSVHPREGTNLIRAVSTGTLPKGFLESATVFSNTSIDPKVWHLSTPTTDQAPSGKTAASEAINLAVVPDEKSR